MDLLKGSTNIAGRIEDYRKKAISMDTEGHLLACSTLAHVLEHNEYSLADKLIWAMGRSQRKNALIRWFTTQAPCTWDTKSEKLKFSKTKKDFGGLEAGIATPFWDLTKEADVVREFDLKKLLMGIVTRCDERLAEATGSDLVHKKTKIHGSTLKALKRMVGEMA